MALENLKKFLEVLSKADLKTNENANGTLTIQQTQRNQQRALMVNELLNDLIDEDMDAYLTADGIILAIEHDEIGTVSIEVKLTFKSLDYDPQLEADAYEEQLQDKEAEKARKAEAKRKKIDSDKAIRAKAKVNEEEQED